MVETPSVLPVRRLLWRVFPLPAPPCAPVGGSPRCPIVSLLRFWVAVRCRQRWLDRTAGRRRRRMAHSNGEYIIDHGAVPKADLFSYSKPGQPWYAWEWLSDVCMALLHRLGGSRPSYSPPDC
jgi:hypothetical protein